MKYQKSQSYIKLTSAMLIFGTIGILRRYIPVSSSVLALFRGILGAVTLIVFTRIKHQKITEDINRKSFIRLMIIGILIGINWVFLFEAYNLTSVSVATLCYYMAPTIVILLSPIVFKEKLTIKKTICASISILGMIFVSGILFSFIQLKDLTGILFGLLAALFYATVVLMNKSVEVNNAYGLTIIELIFASIIVLPYIILTENILLISLDTISIIMILLVGIVHTGIAYAMYFSSMKHLPAQSIAIISYIDPVFALILSTLLLHERFSLMSFIGAVLIISSTFISEVTLKKENG